MYKWNLTLKCQCFAYSMCDVYLLKEDDITSDTGFWPLVFLNPIIGQDFCQNVWSGAITVHS